MFAKFLLLADELNRPRFGEGIKGQALIDVEQALCALDKLDGDRYSVLILAEESPESNSGIPYSGKAIDIGGGENRQYVCTAYIKDETTPTTARSAHIPVSFERQVWLKHAELTPFYAHDVIEHDAVREVIRLFVLRGKLSDKVIWDEYRGR